ncbi:MAG: alanine racemase, partial [Cyclobacteriaceae bacterium]
MLEITRPTLLVNEKVARRNIRNMARKASENSIPLRPHFKTHVSREIGEWFRDEGITTCTVSSVEMAKYFQLAGWDDITIAFPFNRHEIKIVNKLVANIKLNLVIEDTDTLTYLQQHLSGTVNYFIKLDVGTHRTGLHPDSDFSGLIVDTDRTSFKGFLAHAGHSYKCRSHEEIEKVYREVTNQLKVLKSVHPKAVISYGDTPTCSVIDQFEYIDELRPGNFVFYDLMQHTITSCGFDEIAVCMAVPVVAKHEDR